MLKNIFVLLFFVFLFSSCATLVQKSGNILDGSASLSKKIAVYKTGSKDKNALNMELHHLKNKNNEQFLVISQNRFPAITIICSEPNSEGIILVKTAEYISGNTAGWNNFSMDLMGQGSCSLNETEAVLSLNADLEKVQIAKGKIRLYDTTLIGNDALTNLRNRYERIEALTGWMNELENAAANSGRRDFKKFWEAVLFPETVPKNRRPDNWAQNTDVYSKADNIKWNTSYTTRVLPEMLRELRNSGTLLRD